MEENKGVCNVCSASDVNVNEEGKCENCAPPSEHEHHSGHNHENKE